MQLIYQGVTDLVGGIKYTKTDQYRKKYQVIFTSNIGNNLASLIGNTEDNHQNLGDGDLCVLMQSGQFHNLPQACQIWCKINSHL